jgi:DNA polymerase III delta subunit
MHLGEMHRGDTMRITNELAKLALYTMGRDATIDDVDVICHGEREDSVWQFLDAMQDGQLGFALTALPKLKEEADSHQGTLALILRAYRQSATVLDLLEEGATEEQIGVAINRKWARGRQEAIRRARMLGREGVRQAFELVVEADRATKSGLTGEDVAVELLVTRLAGLAHLPRVAAPARRGP